MTPDEIKLNCGRDSKCDLDRPSLGVVCWSCFDRAIAVAVESEQDALRSALNEFRASRGEERTELKYAFNTVERWLMDRARGGR